MPRLLIAAGDSASNVKELPFGAQALIEAADQILVVTPALPGRLDWITSATDKARERADERLRTVLGQLAEIGGEADGEVGADDPLLAFEDALAEFAADHILIGLRSEKRPGWQERGLVEALLERFQIPITVFELS